MPRHLLRDDLLVQHVDEAARANVLHAGIEVTDARNDQAIGFPDHVDVGRHRRGVADLLHHVDDRSDIAHVVIDDDDHGPL
jgi:hypothetical protein